MTPEEHVTAIEAALRAAESDGYYVSIDNTCNGCCSEFEAHLVSFDWQNNPLSLEVEI